MKDRQLENGTIFKILSIDAWRDMEGWTWNNWFEIEEGIYIDKKCQTPRKIFKLLRDWGFLSEDSKGKIYMDDDQYNLTIHDKATGCPVLALEYGSLREES
jgi:hypothetical protein